MAVEEAHKMSASFLGEIRETKRYQLGKLRLRFSFH